MKKSTPTDHDSVRILCDFVRFLSDSVRFLRRITCAAASGDSGGAEPEARHAKSVLRNRNLPGLKEWWLHAPCGRWAVDGRWTADGGRWMVVYRVILMSNRKIAGRLTAGNKTHDIIVNSFALELCFSCANSCQHLAENLPGRHFLH